MAHQVIQRTGLRWITTQPRVLAVALDQTALLEQPPDALGDVLDQ